MNLSNRNRKVANSRWVQIHDLERSKINNDLEKKAAICGFLAGDGSVQIRKEKDKIHYQLDFFPDDKLMKNKYLEYIFDVFKKTPSVVKRDNVIHVRLTSKVVVLELKKIAKFGLNTWHVPDFLSADELKIAWLKAFFSAEAYVGKNNIKLQTINKKGMRAVNVMLKQLDIESKYYVYFPKCIRWSDVFILVITGKKNRLLFYEKIGFWHEKKNDALKKSYAFSWCQPANRQSRR